MNPLVRTALLAADAAGAVQQRYSGRLRVDRASEKNPRDYVSEADVEAQRAALAVIRERHPGHLVLAEEDDACGDGGGDVVVGETDGVDAPLWVVDPLDGTTNFLHHHPMRSVSVAVVMDGEPVAGAVVCPATSERWWAAKGEGAWRNGRRIRTSGATELRSALVGTGFPFKALDRVDEYAAQLARVLEASAGARRGGSAAMDLAYLAQGTFDAFWELDLAPWDIAAGVLLVREAGGVVTRVDGSRMDVLRRGGVLGGAGEGVWSALGEVCRAVLPGM